jgi:catechol 2,3-dioxygenase-like lactoylglutathione lyase family enzyme
VPIAVHLALRVQDLDAVISRLESDKVPWSDSDKNPRATAIRGDGIRQLYLQDPDGYWIEVNEVPIPRS